MCKELNNTARINTYLKKCYNLINEHFFNNELPAVVITIVPTRTAYAHFTLNPNTWTTADGNGFHEINISANYINRNIEEICASLIHEMCHFYALIHDIKDVSRNGQYHNSAFKEIGETHGIKVSKDPLYGWTVTEASEELIEFCIDNDLKNIDLVRNAETYIPTTTTAGNGMKTTTGIEPTPKKTSTRKYVCPCCGNSFRATKDINVLCMDCNVQYIKA